MRKIIAPILLVATLLLSLASCQTTAPLSSATPSTSPQAESTPKETSQEAEPLEPAEVPESNLAATEKTPPSTPASTASKYVFIHKTNHVGVLEADGTVTETGYYFQSKPVYQQSTGRFFYTAHSTPTISQEEFKAGMLQDTTGMDLSYYIYYTDSLEAGATPVEMNESTIIPRTDNFVISGDNLLIASSYEEVTLLNLTSKEKKTYNVFDSSSNNVFKGNKVYYNRKTEAGAAVYETDMLTGEAKELYSSQGVAYIVAGGEYIIVSAYGGVYDYINTITGQTGNFPIVSETNFTFLGFDDANYFFVTDQYTDNPKLVTATFDSSGNAVVSESVALPSSKDRISSGEIVDGELYLNTIIGPGESKLLYKYSPKTGTTTALSSEDEIKWTPLEVA